MEHFQTIFFKFKKIQKKLKLKKLSTPLGHFPTITE